MNYEELDVKDLPKILEDREKYWNSTINELSKKLNCSAKDVTPLQAEVISSRQELVEEIKSVSYELYKYMPKIKALKKQRFEFYHTKYPIATNGSEKMKLIEWDLANYEHKKDIFDVHIEFLRESMKDIDNMGYAIKNKVLLYQLTDLE